MWTKVLVEDGADNLARNFDAFYFLGPRDVFSFFTENGSQSMTAGIQSYFARKISTDAAFRDYFSIPDIAWGDSMKHGPHLNRERNGAICGEISCASTVCARAPTSASAATTNGRSCVWSTPSGASEALDPISLTATSATSSRRSSTVFR
jgi:hypothetical protein